MKKYAIVDIDGTVSKIGDRVKFLEMDPPDWDSFYKDCFEDEPVNSIIRLIKCLQNSYQIVFCTGRRESVRDITLDWLRRNCFLVSTTALLMRKDGDKRHDIIVKPELLKEAGIQLHDIALVFEDRASMVRKWRSLGLTCLQVSEANF